MTNTSTEDTFDFQEFLQSNELAELRDFAKGRDIIYSVTGLISIISRQQSYGIIY